MMQKIYYLQICLQPVPMGYNELSINIISQDVQNCFWDNLAPSTDRCTPDGALESLQQELLIDNISVIIKHEKRLKWAFQCFSAS